MLIKQSLQKDTLKTVTKVKYSATLIVQIPQKEATKEMYYS